MTFDSIQEAVMPSAGTKIADSIQNVAVATEKSADAGSMGIKGMLLNNVGNMAAMAIIAVAFLYLQREQIVNAREDRVMFREFGKAFNDSADRRFEKSEISHGRAFEKMGNTIERAVVSMEGATKELKDATRKINP